MKLSLLPLLLALSLPAFAACPKNKKEWQSRGPKILVEKASRQHAAIDLPDFSALFDAKKGKNDKAPKATGSAVPFKNKAGEFVMVQARDEETSLFLSGILKCDNARQEPVLMSLTYVLGDKSGLIKVLKQ